MRYSQFGSKNSEKVSKLGFGCMRFPMISVNGKNVCDQDKVTEMVKYAYENGVNYFDTAYFYCDGDSEIALGRAIKELGIRDKIWLSTKNPGHIANGEGKYTEILMDQLKKLQVDYIDFYHFHGIGYENFVNDDKKYGWVKEALTAKEKGLIKHISFSFHDDPENMIKLIDLGIFDSVLCQYNMVDRSNEKSMAYAREKGLGVVVMGPVGGGKLAKLPDKFFTESGLPVQNSANLALRFVMANPNVNIVLSGMQDLDMIKNNVDTASNAEPLSPEEVEIINVLIEKNYEMAKLYCSGCKYCMPCPKGVEIPKIFDIYTQYKVFGFEEFAKGQYKDLGVQEWSPGEKADKCIECGKCELRCPQKIKIREQLKICHEVLSEK